MFVKLKNLWKYPKGIKVQIDNKELYYIGIFDGDGQAMFWDGYNISYQDDYDLDEEYEIFIFEYNANKALKVLIDAYTSLVISWAIEDPFVMEEDIKFTSKTLEILNQLKEMSQNQRS